MKKKVCMIVQHPMVKGGIAAVVNGYRGSTLEEKYDVIYVESYKDGNKFIKLVKALKGYVHFAKVLFCDRPNLVHLHSSFGASFYRSIPFIYMASWANTPIINHIHGADFKEFYLDVSEQKKKKIRKVYSKCSKLIALSEQWKENISLIVPKEKIVVIENYSILHEDALQQRLNRPCNNIILFLGELGRRKGCYDIPSVIQKVVMVIPNVKFVLCGTGSSEDENAIKMLIKEKGVEKNVRFLGWVRDERKDKILREADVFFLPSYNEGMPMSILDAMGYGLSVVGTNVGGIPKIVRHGENGFCCKPGDIDGFAQGIIKLLTNKEERNRAAEESIRIVKSGYSLETHLRLLEQTYETI